MTIFLLNYIKVSKEKGILQKVMAFRRIKFKRIDIQIVAYLKNMKQKKLFIIIIFYDFELWILAESVFLLEIFILNKNHSLLDNPLIFPKMKILISIWSQRTENQKFNRKENVMSERVKMPVRHFLRSDYLHIFFSIKFLVFVSLDPQISI